MHGWRVLVLPYLDQSTLYKQYHFDQPWDGTSNFTLADQIPEIYQCPSYAHHREHEGTAEENDAVMTSYTLLTAVTGVFHGEKCCSRSDITDTHGETLLAVDAPGIAVPWLSPRDLSMDELLRRLSGESEEKFSFHHPGGFLALFADGRVRFLPETTSPQLIKKITTFAGCEKVEGY